MTFGTGLCVITALSLSQNEQIKFTTLHYISKSIFCIYKTKSGRHELKPKAPRSIDLHNRSSNAQRRFVPYTNKTSLDLEEEGLGIDDLSSWSLDDNMKHILYDTDVNHKKSNIKVATQKPLANTNKKRVTIKDNDQDTLADLDGDYMFDNLLEEEKQNDKVFQSILNDLSNIERKERQLKNGDGMSDYKDNDEDDYVNQVSVDDLKNFSLSAGSESAMSSFIDWDQIDQLVDTLK